MNIHKYPDLYSSSAMLNSTEVKMAAPTEACVADYYKGRRIFITGASGFIGKVLIEKLLRSCPEIDKIYILMRPKKSQDIHQRTEGILKMKLFDQLRKTQPEFENKIIPVKGDITLPDIGLSEADKTTLEDEVHVIFHSAATVRFDEPLRLSTEMNVVAVRRIINLAKNLKHLQALIHVSTAYCNCDHRKIEERVYPTDVEPQKLIDMLEWLDDEIVDHMTPKLLGDKPNTYTFTKQLGEALLVKEGDGLPVAIVRPSIVGAAWKEPMPGWIDNFNGPSGLCVAAGKGILRSMRGEHNAVADIIPVDIPVNLMITSAWYTAVHKPKQIMVYHSTIGSVNPITWGSIVSASRVNGILKRTPYDDCFRRPNLVLTENSFFHKYKLIVCHLIPAHLSDLLYRLAGKKPRMVSIYKKVHKMADLLTYFTSNTWDWTCRNLHVLQDTLSTQDRKTFYIDPQSLDWSSYLEDYCLGTKIYVLNEKIENLPAAKAHLRRLRNLRYLFNTVMAITIWKLAGSNVVSKVWNFIVNIVFKFLNFFRISSRK